MISAAEIERLKLVRYPDPMLRRRCRPIESFGSHLEELGRRMLDMMREHKGVGLAGPQVGLPWRIFVWNSTGHADDDHICINPRLENLSGQIEAEEGCLSIEEVTVRIRRARAAELVGQSPDGAALRRAGEELLARIWQHEIDHLDGRLILDYQSPAEEIANRKAIRQLEASYQAKHKPRRKP